MFRGVIPSLVWLATLEHMHLSRLVTPVSRETVIDHRGWSGQILPSEYNALRDHWHDCSRCRLTYSSFEILSNVPILVIIIEVELTAAEVLVLVPISSC